MTRADLTKPGAAFALVLLLLGMFEGLRLVGYTDIAGVPTFCYGQTGKDAVVGKRYPRELCDELLSEEGYKYWEAVDSAVKSEMTPWQWAALTLYSYNMGVGALKSSTMLAIANQGRWVDACHELPKWNRARKGAGGPKIVWPGLVKRRTVEMFLCLGYVFDDEFSPNHRTRKPILR